jgi:uncharacterized protein (UPF0147 family)
MDLQEEYQQRHGLVVPVVRYVDKNYLLVTPRSPEEGQAVPWIGLSITFSTKPDNLPGTFRFTLNNPVHDLMSGGSVGAPLRHSWDKKLEFDEWEGFILSWAKSNQSQWMPVTDPEQVRMAVWEIFVHAMDSWLSSSMSSNQIERLGVILDRESPADVRKAAEEEIETFLKNKNRVASAALHNLHSTYGDPDLYASWLARVLV